MQNSLVRTILIQVWETFLKPTMHACTLFKIEWRLWVYEEAPRRITADFAQILVHEIPRAVSRPLSACTRLDLHLDVALVTAVLEFRSEPRLVQARAGSSYPLGNTLLFRSSVQRTF